MFWFRLVPTKHNLNLVIHFRKFVDQKLFRMIISIAFLISILNLIIFIVHTGVVEDAAKCHWPRKSKTKSCHPKVFGLGLTRWRWSGGSLQNHPRDQQRIPAVEGIPRVLYWGTSVQYDFFNNIFWSHQLIILIVKEFIFRNSFTLLWLTIY